MICSIQYNIMSRRGPALFSCGVGSRTCQPS